MRRKRMRLVSLILSAVCLLGCAVQPAPVSDSSESNTKVSAYAASQAEQNERGAHGGRIPAAANRRWRRYI